MERPEEQQALVVDARPQHGAEDGAHDSFDAIPTVYMGKIEKNPFIMMQEASSHSSMASLHSVHKSSTSFHSSNLLIEKSEQPAIERAMPGRRPRFYLPWLNAYRGLMAVVIIVNLSVLVPCIIFKWTVQAPLTATAANILAAVLLRQGDVINATFTLVAKVPVTIPLSIRKLLGDLHHFGGVHIGCAISALLWYLTFVVLDTFRDLDLRVHGSMTIWLYIDIITAWLFLLAILAICITALPHCRVHFHNTFEHTHRFGGWTALIVLWVHAGIATLTSSNTSPLYFQPAIWMLAATTCLIILPWLRIRRVPITAVKLSAHSIQITYPFTDMAYTSTMRFSTSPLKEWHGFASIPASSTTSTIIIAAAGDWTKSIIANPPTHLWLRHPPTRNFLTLAPLFNSLLLVATGAGIAPMLSLLTSPALHRMRLQGRKVKVMWCAAEPWAPHWEFVMDAIRGVDGAPRIFDSKKGRVDMGFEAAAMACEEGVEAVMVVGNARVTANVVDGCGSAGIKAYGAVFDS